MDEVISMLEEAKKRISKEKNWVQGLQAVDKDGNEVLPHWKAKKKEEPAAVRWSAAVSIMAMAGRDIVPAFRALADMAADRGCPGIDSFNDTHTHEEVLELFDHAIAYIAFAPQDA